MAEFIHPSTHAYIVLAIVVVFRLPWLFHRFLDARRDLDDYRDEQKGR